MTPEQEKLLQDLAGRMNRLEKSDRYTFEKDLQLLNGRNIQVGVLNGTSIGTRPTQKVSIYGVPAVVQASSISNPSGGTTIDSQSRSAIASIITALKNFGITA